MPKAPAFQLFAADFYMDTAGWSATEVGAYFRLLMAEWVNGPLRNDMAQLARIAGVDIKTMKKFWESSLGTKFVPSTKGKFPPSYTGKIPNENGIVAWENSRLEQTRTEQDEHRQKLIESGRLGGLKTQGEKKKQSIEASSEASSENKALLLLSSKDINTLVISGANNTCPHQEIIKLYHDILPVLPQVRVWTPKRQKMLKARWSSSVEYQDLDWWKQFFEFVRDDCPHLTGKNDRQWTADLEWLCKEENFVKTVEGRYHQK
jgi:hypothetical protein